ncbi:RIP metalloprotease RseP [Algirhabdus cladophorae]|uniref:RIP metalloprotease RseP n=1 Tax=Algirhabdus cladophorae TaxID=3377108 RepID=UPI003B84AC12
MDPTSLIPAFGGLAYTLVAFVVALSIIVAIHEYGHYIVGRWCGIHAETFSLGFGPVIYSRVDRRGTKWQLAALPFGGFVKFLGDSNAASVGADSDVKPARNTMHGAPLWARAATVAAGPVFNFILSILVFGAVIMFTGRAADPLTVDSFVKMPAGVVQELQEGDQILEVNGQPANTTELFNGLIEDLDVARSIDYRVRRGGDTITVQGPFPNQAIVLGLSPRSAALSVQMKLGDVVTAIDGAEIYAFDQMRDIVVASDGKPLLFDVWRDGEMMQFTLVPKRVDLPQEDGTFDTRWLVGISSGLFFEPKTEFPGVWASLQSGVERTGFVIRSSMSGLYNVITGAISSCNLSGPVGIAQTSAAMASQGAQSFIWFIAVLSTAVGLLNLFPIPVLDGGHLVFHAYEAVTGKPPSDKILNILMITGLTLLLSLMVFALGNDLFCP